LFRFFGIFGLPFQANSLSQPGPKTPGQVKIIRHSLDFLRRKGFRTVYGHAAADLGDYWRRIGWQACGDAFRFSGHDFVPMTRDLGPAAQQPFGIDTDPLILNRPERQRDQPGVLDFSASR
jgi:hypothetical protein